MDQAANHIELSLVFPIYNEEETIPLLKQELDRFFSSSSYSHELIFVNDGSSDRTAELLDQWALGKNNIKIISFQKNQSHQKALIEGLRIAKGKYVVTLDADLQDPLEMIPVMLLKSEEGYDVVHAKRISREGEGFVRKFLAWSFYRISRYIFFRNIFLDVGDFRLMSDTAVAEYFSLVQTPSMLRKEIPSLPISQSVIAYKRKPRIAGQSKFTIQKLIQLAMAGSKKSKKKN